MSDEHKGHRSRLRERFERDGIDSLEPHVVLELILFYSIPRGDTNPIAHNLLKRFGSIANVFEASQEDLMKVDGVGSSSATLLRLIPGITKRYLLDKCSEGVILDSSKKLGEYILPQFIGKNKEYVLLLCFDQKNKLLFCDIIMEGTLDSVTVDIRKIVEIAISVSASSIVLAHNHTQGFAIPSYEDKKATIMVKKALIPLSIRLVDHIIVARDDYISFAQSGLLSFDDIL